MRVEATKLVFMILACWLVLVACTSNDSGNRTDASKATRSPKAFNSRFVSSLVSLESGTRKSFVTHLRDCYLPVWRQLQSVGVLSNVSVFELSYYDSTIVSTSVCDYLILSELETNAAPTNLLDAEKALACRRSQEIPLFSVLRSAYMSCTPNSCYGMPEPDQEVAGTQIQYLVEFIGVEDTPDLLAKYRELMINYFGPANGMLVESGMLHCFVALENTEILSNSPGATPWNQIHISDDWDEGGNVDWDSVYVELFRSNFSCDLDSVWAEIPPTDNSRYDSRGRLISELCVK